MKTIFCLIIFSFTIKAQQFIVMGKAQRDSLINILLPKFNNYMDSHQIDIDPIMIKDSTYILPVDLLEKAEWKPIKDEFQSSGYLGKLTIREVLPNEFIKPKMPWDK